MHPSPTGHSEPAKLLEHLTGPNPSRGEVAVQFGAAGLAVLLMTGGILLSDPGWDIWQICFALFLALDLAGGVATNATPSAKRWFHRPGRTRLHHFLFVALHVHPFIMVLLYDVGGWMYAGVSYGFVITGAAMILAVPARLRRPVAFCLILLSLLPAFYLFNVPPALEWVFPVYCMKLLASHLLPG